MALYLFVFLSLFSPGPNIILLTASGARFGFAASLPHIFGVALGCGFIAGLSALGVSSVLLAAPGLTFALKIVAAAWILWMAFGLMRSKASTSSHNERPFTFVEAVLFQAVNPKIWAIALAATAGYSAGLPPVGEALRLASAFSGINLFVCLFWTYAGTLLALLLNSQPAWRRFRLVMGILLAASAAMVFF